MFARDGIVVRVLDQLVECPPGHRVGAFVDGRQTWFQHDEVGVVAQHLADEIVDERRIDEGCVGSDADNDVRVDCLCCKCVAREHVVFGASDNDCALRLRIGCEFVVSWIGGCCDAQRLNEVRFFQTMKHVPEQRLTRDGLQDFSWHAG